MTILLAIIFGCEEKFSLPGSNDAQEALLVVDGRISDQEGPYTVKLSTSRAIDSAFSTNETGAIVKIEEKDGPTVTLEEVSPGVYLTIPGEIRGQIGKEYRLLILLSNNERFLSSWELLEATPAIGKIHHEFHTVSNDLERRATGVQLYVDTNDETGQSLFFRWEVEETWIYEAPIVSDLIYLGNDMIAPKPPEDHHQICWRQAKVPNIMIASVNQQSESVIRKQPLSFIPNDLARFDQRYSVLVKQYSLSLQEYDFWKNLENTNEIVGSLFDRQPFQVTGNVHNREDSDMAVLGYFSATAITEKRIFINNTDFPTGFRPEPYFDYCEIIAYRKLCGLASPCFERTEEQIMDLVVVGGQVFHSLHEDLGGWNFTERFCGDCETFGGSTSKPTFWED